MLEIGHAQGLKAEELLPEWVAFSTRNGSCDLDGDMLEQWETDLERSANRKTPKSRRNVSKTTGFTTPTNGTTGTYSQDDLDHL